MTKTEALEQLKQQTSKDFQEMFNDSFESLFNDLWVLGYCLSSAYLMGDSVCISIIPENKNLPEIIARGWQSKDRIEFRIQSFSVGALTLAELDNYLAGYETAREAVKILNGFTFCDLWQSRK